MIKFFAFCVFESELCKDRGHVSENDSAFKTISRRLRYNSFEGLAFLLEP